MAYHMNLVTRYFQFRRIKETTISEVDMLKDFSKWLHRHLEAAEQSVQATALRWFLFGLFLGSGFVLLAGQILSGA